MYLCLCSMHGSIAVAVAVLNWFLVLIVWTGNEKYSFNYVKEVEKIYFALKTHNSKALHFIARKCSFGIIGTITFIHIFSAQRCYTYAYLYLTQLNPNKPMRLHLRIVVPWQSISMLLFNSEWILRRIYRVNDDSSINGDCIFWRWLLLALPLPLPSLSNAIFFNDSIRRAT